MEHRWYPLECLILTINIIAAIPWYIVEETIYGDFDIFMMSQHFSSMENVPMHLINHVLVKYKCNVSLSTIKVTTFIYSIDVSFYFVSCIVINVLISFMIAYVLLHVEKELVSEHRTLFHCIWYGIIWLFILFLCYFGLDV